MSPPLSPAVRLIAYLNLMAAGMALLVALGQSADDEPVEVAIVRALGDKATPEAREAARRAEHARDVRRRLREHLEVAVPPSRWAGRASQIVDVLAVTLLLISGTMLLQRHPFGRPAGLAYAGLAVVQKVFLIGYLALWEQPAAEAFLKSLKSWSADDAVSAQSLIDQHLLTLASHMIFAVYPFVVAFVLWPDEPPALPGQTVTPPRADEPPPKSGPKPAIDVPPPDDFDALLKRKPSY